MAAVISFAHGMSYLGLVSTMKFQPMENLGWSTDPSHAGRRVALVLGTNLGLLKKVLG